MITRLSEFIERKGMSVLSLEKSIGTRGTIQNAIENNSNLGVKWISKIFEVYPNLSAEWLFRGEGEMERGEVDLNVFRAMEILYQNADQAVMLDSFNELMNKLGLVKENKELRDRIKRIEEQLGGSK